MNIQQRNSAYHFRMQSEREQTLVLILLDRLHKIRVLLDKMRANCKKFYQPHQHVSVDERMVNKTLGRARDPHANGVWLSKLTE